MRADGAGTGEMDAMLEYLCLDMGPGEAGEANETLELFLTLGADIGTARQKVAELFSPPRVTTEIARLPSVHLAPGETFDLHEGRAGAMLELLASR